jgi:protein-tyrosine phosphatase
MDLTELPFGLQGRVFRSPMPFGTRDPQGHIYQAYKEEGVSVIVLLAEAHECLKKANRDLRALYAADGFSVVHVPIPDYGIPPEATSFHEALYITITYLRSGKHTAIHCSAGIGRTGLFAACMARVILGLPGEQAIQWVRQFIPELCDSD